MAGQPENYRIRAGIGVVTISYEAAVELLARLEQADVLDDVAAAFVGYDLSGETPIEISADDKRQLRAVIDEWAREVGAANLPRGVEGLGHALDDDLRTAPRD